jgi:hypothetical protein
MVLDVLALVLVLAVRWCAKRFSEPEPLPPELPFEDQPPVTADAEHPRGRRFDDYVEGGFGEIDQWLHHRDEAA